MSRNKYGAKKVVVDGVTFDSKAEALYYLVLKDRKKNGEIKDFSLQPKFTLLKPFEKMGTKHRAITYTADFRVIHNDESVEIIDIKGFEPRDFPLRRKMFDSNYPDLKLTIISECPQKYGGGFIEIDRLKKLRAGNKTAKGVVASGTKARRKKAATKETQ